jgi:predicted TIM-barrel fold metal-dependent hydrolase
MPAKPGKMNLREIIGIDVHAHYNHGSPHDTKTSEIYRADLEYLKETYDAANIRVAFCSTFAAVLSPVGIVAENEYNYVLSRETDWLYQWVVVDPRSEETFRQAERMLPSRKCVGLKIHPAYHGYSIFDYADRIFSFAADYRTIVQMHPEKPAEMPVFADRYPDMKLIIAHLGSVEHIQAIRHARWGNIYADTSGNASVNNRIIELAVEQAGSDHILFGTDTYAAAFQRGRIEYALIADEDKANILHRNALRLFKNNLPPEMTRPNTP